MGKWFIVRLLLVLLWGLMGTSDQITYKGEKSFAVSVVATLFAFAATYVILRRGIREQRKKENWEPPSWYSNPFSGRAQFFHLAGWAWMAFGLPGLRHLNNLPSAIAHVTMLGFGLGILIAIKVFYWRNQATIKESI